MLTLKTLLWHEEKDAKNRIFILALNGSQQCDFDQNQPRKRIIALFHPDDGYVYKDHKQLKLSSASVDEIQSWEQFFLQAFSHEPNVSCPTQIDFSVKQFSINYDIRLFYSNFRIKEKQINVRMNWMQNLMNKSTLLTKKSTLTLG